MVDSSNPGTRGATNTITGHFNNLKAAAIATQGQTNDSTVGVPGEGVLPGCEQYIDSWVTQTTLCGKNLYDNFNVQHQIPRSTKQYSWISSSLMSDHGHVGFVPPSWYIKKSKLGMDVSEGEEYVACYSLLSASDYGSYSSSIGRYYGATIVEADVGTHDASDFIPVDFAGLNTIIYEPVTASDNVLGYPLDLALPTNAVNDTSGRPKDAAGNFKSFLRS